MNTQQNESHQNLAESNFSIAFFNNLICESGGGPYWIAFEEQAINTFISCGFNLIVASSQCEHPLATSIEILIQLAYSEDSLINLGKCGEITLRWASNNAETKCATFLLLPEGSSIAHVQIVIHQERSYVVFPCFLSWEGDHTNWNWLRENIIDGIFEGILS